MADWLSSKIGTTNQNNQLGGTSSSNDWLSSVSTGKSTYTPNKLVSEIEPTVKVEETKKKNFLGNVTNWLKSFGKEIGRSTKPAIQSFASTVKTLPVTLSRVINTPLDSYIPIYERITGKDPGTVRENYLNWAMKDSFDAKQYLINNPIEADTKPFKEQIKDPQWIARGLTMNLPNFVATTGIGLATGGIGVIPTAISLEQASFYQQAREDGVDDRDAIRLATGYGVLSGIAEALVPGELGEGKIITKALQGNLKKELIGMVVNSTLEGTTEVVQEILGNAFKKTYDENQKLTEGWKEAGFFGVLIGLVGDGSIKVTNKGIEATGVVFNKDATAITNEQESIMTPDAVLSKIIGSEQQNTEYGKMLIKLATEAKISGKDIKINTTGGKLKAELVGKEETNIPDDIRRQAELGEIKDDIRETATSGLQLAEQGVYAEITPEQLDYLKDEVGNIKFTKEDKPHLSPLTSLESSDLRRVSLEEIREMSPNIDEALNRLEEKIGESRVEDLNRPFNEENTRKVINQTIDGERESFRLDNEENIKNYRFSDAKPTDTVIIYRAGTGEINPGDYVTVSKDRAEKVYLKEREGSKLLEIEAPLESLVYGNGLKNEFIYLPKEEIGKVTKKEVISLEEKPVKQPKIVSEQKTQISEKERIDKEIKITAQKKKEASRRPVDAEGTPRRSSAFAKVENQLKAEVSDDTTYNRLNLAEDASRALEFVKQNPKRAERIAKGLELAPPDITETAISIAMAEKAREDGNYALQAELIAKRSLRQTRRGQEIVTEKTVNSLSSDRFIRDVFNARMELIAKGKQWTFSKVNKNNKSKVKKAQEVIDQNAQQIKNQVDKTTKSKLESAQDLLSKLTCK